MNKISFMVSLLICVLVQPVFADQAEDGRNAGKLLGTDITSQLNSSGKLNERFSQPLTSSATPLKTFGDPSKQISFDGQISTKASSTFLEILIQPGATGDLTTVVVKQDLDLNGTADYVYNPPSHISGVCANGYISCNAGTWNNCSYYNWKTNSSLEVGAVSAAGINSLAACYCINNSCGSNLVWENITVVLKDLGGAVVGAIQDTNPQYTITNVSVDNTLIKYYGQLSTELGSQTGGYFSGSQTPENYYNPTSGILPTDDLLLAQAGDPESYYSQVNESLSVQNNPVEIQTCYNRKQIVFNDGDPNVSSTTNCLAIDPANCNLKQESVCDYNNRNCILTLDNYNPTSFSPLANCQEISNDSTSYNFCASGASIYQATPVPIITFLSGSNTWWNINKTYQCTTDNDYSADEGVGKAGAAQASAQLDNGTVTYGDYDSDTGTTTTRSFSLDTELNPENCEMACKVKAAITDTEASNSGLTIDYRTTVDSTTSYVRNCNQGPCPVGPGEIIEKDCSCLNNFAETTSVMQALHEASKDIVCSSRNLP